MTIYTHNGFAHLDDTIALGLILVKHPKATVVRTNKVPDNVQSDDVLKTGYCYPMGGKFSGNRQKSRSDRHD